jgi:hypothetical protein
MADHDPTVADHTLSVRLDVELEREPICGRLRTDDGADEPFVGWLGFMDALRRVQEERRDPFKEVSRRPHTVRPTFDAELDRDDRRSDVDADDDPS